MSTSPISLFMAALWLGLQINWSVKMGTGARHSYYDRSNTKRLSFHQGHPVNDANTRNSVFFVWDVCFHCLFSITASPCGFILLIRYDRGPASPCTYVCSKQILPHPGGSIWRRMFQKDAIRELSGVLYFLCLNTLPRMKMKEDK